MSAALVLAGLVLLALPGLRILPFGQLNPAEWARAATLSLRAGYAITRLGLLFGAGPTILRAVGVEHAADACHRMFGPVAPGGPLVGWASAAGFTWLTLSRRAARRAQREGFARTQVEPWLGAHETHDGVDVVTLPLHEPVAYAVPLGKGQIVISDGLAQALEPAELRAVIAHETSHLRNRHDRHLGVAATVERAFGWLVPIRASTANVRLAIERWADEDAAPTQTERHLVRDALAKTTSSLLGPALAFAATCTVLERLDALDEEPPAPGTRTRIAALGPLVAAGLATIVLLGLWSTYTHHGLLGVLGFCPESQH